MSTRVCEQEGMEMVQVAFMIGVGVLIAASLMSFCGDTLIPGLSAAAQSASNSLYEGGMVSKENQSGGSIL